MRLLGALGLFSLGLINIFGFVRSIQERDFKGIALMVFMAMLLTFFAVTLWRGAKFEHGFAKGRLAGGWAGKSVSAFFTNVVMKSLEGKIYITGAVACVVVAVLALAWPEAIRISPDKAANRAVLFGLWPIVSFTLYVRISGPTYQTRISTVLLTLASVMIPFYVSYG